MESTSGSKLFLGPFRLPADGTNAFAGLLSGILAHVEKIQQLKSMSLQTISSIYLSKKLFRGENLDLDVYVYYFECGPQHLIRRRETARRPERLTDWSAPHFSRYVYLDIGKKGTLTKIITFDSSAFMDRGVYLDRYE
jgi:hypothetical protein